MAGEATLITNPDFDVDTTTLKKFIDMYQDESGNSADYKKKFLNLTKKGKPLEKYLNSPIKDIFEDGDAFANFYDSEAKRLDVTKDTFKIKGPPNIGNLTTACFADHIVQDNTKNRQSDAVSHYNAQLAAVSP